jgi:hypothetical protein
MKIGAAQPRQCRRSEFAWCYESVEEFDPGFPRHHGLLPPVMGEYAGENLSTKETSLTRVVTQTYLREAHDASSV